MLNNVRRLLLLPGPLTTSHRVKLESFIDFSPREFKFIEIIKNIQKKNITYW